NAGRQCVGGLEIERTAPESSLNRPMLGDCLGARWTSLQMLLHFQVAEEIQLAVEISVQQMVRFLASHIRRPSSSVESGVAAIGHGLGPIATSPCPPE